MENPTEAENPFMDDYIHAQLAIRALDERIAALETEKRLYKLRCHHIIQAAYEAGRPL